MPISSGGEGHVGLGVDTSVKWTPNGWEDVHGFKNSNSYLQRYLSHHADGGKKKSESRTVQQTQNERLHKTGDRQVSEKEYHIMNHKEQQRKSQTRAQDDAPKATICTPSDSQINSTDTVKGFSKAAASKKQTTTSAAPTKKSSTCSIL